MFIRCDTCPTDVDLASITFDDLVELSWDRVQQCRLDGYEMYDDEAVAWEQLMAAKFTEQRAT